MTQMALALHLTPFFDWLGPTTRQLPPRCWLSFAMLYAFLALQCDTSGKLG